MKNLNYKELRSYASAFVSFVLSKIDVDEIILFGSVAREEADKNSDIDLFFNVKEEEEQKKSKEIIKLEIERFYKSKIFESWRLKGISNEIKFEIGNLDRWKLKRSIISEGIVLYGRYKEMPENKKAFIYFVITPIKKIAKRNKIIRKLFGRGEKEYNTKGVIEEFGGRRFSPSSFMVPAEKSSEVLRFLNLEKINFKFFELWTDEIA